MTNRKHCYLSFCLSFLGAILLSLVSAQAQQPPTLVIEGGTLIDGNGGAPVRDSVVVIQGNKIAAVSRKGQAPYPANAQVIKADGKFIVPGLFDSQVAYSWYFGEAMINHGVTSTTDVGTLGEVSVPHREAVMHSKALSPRAFTGISFISTKHEGRWANWTGMETPLTPNSAPKTVEELREMVKARIAAGADYIIFQDGNLPMEFYRAGFEEANKAGKPVFTRAYGPNFYPKDAAMMGAASLPHSAGVAAAVAKDTFKGGRDDSNDLDRFAEMDDAKAKDLVQLLVQHKVAVVPTFMINYPGYPKDWARFEEQDRRMFADRNLLTYYAESAMLSALGSYNRIDRGAVRDRRMKGYQNSIRFHKMFADAGGHLVVSANTNDTKTPGLSQHHEMQIMAGEVGLTPMQVIQGSTKWAAELVKRGDQLGTIESGKLADIVIVNEDPLQSINNLEKIDNVIFDGKVVDRTYHPWYSTPFMHVSSFSAPVDGLLWVAAIKQAFRRGQGSGYEGGGERVVALPDPVSSPQPAIESIEPIMVTEGSPTLTLTIKGLNFVRRSTVYFNGVPVPYRAVNPAELQATVDANLLRSVGRFEIVVKNADPMDQAFSPVWGNGTSNKAHLIVDYKY